MQMLTTKDPGDSQTRSSAFKPVGAGAKSPITLSSNSRKRDSGYSSDFSPARVKNPDLTFTFDDDELDDESCVFHAGDDDIDISADEDVFVNQFESVMNVIFEEENDDEDADREVEELLNDDVDTDTEVSQSDQIRRPSAPLPSPEVSGYSSESSESDELCLIASPFYHTKWTMKDRVLFINPFRPIVSRSVGTQTPNPHCQLVQDALRSNTLMLNRESTSRRLQEHSVSEQPFSPLPDVVPMSRDRSISLPDVQSFHVQVQQQQVGRELRRISDDFHSVYLKRHCRRSRTRSEDSSLSSRLRVDVPACWNSLRRLVSGSPLFQAWSTDHH